MTDSNPIGIIGCGNMGFALAHRLDRCGFKVVMGTRTPDTRKHTVYTITTVADCVERCSIIFVAIRPEHYTQSLVSPFEEKPEIFQGKILIDLSNEIDKAKTENLSNAERLQAAIPNAYVVKAFNTLSAFAIESPTAGESRSVFVASDHPSARDKVMTLAREMNFESYGSGSLRSARELEAYTRTLFPGWHLALLILIGVLTFWSMYTIYMRFVKTKTISWHQIFLHVTNKVLCVSAITMLSLVYMPSNLACIFQLAYGTRERRFPNWLDRWLVSRKQLGLLTFSIGLFHATITLALMSPAYYSSWFHPVKATLTPKPVDNQTVVSVQLGMMNVKGESATLLGILTLLTMSILALASIPAIGNLLNWREWRFIQSTLGTVTLAFAIGHVFAMAMPRWLEIGFVKSLSSVGLHCVLLPLFTILLKFIFCLPCFSRPIERIRRGEIRKEIV